MSPTDRDANERRGERTGRVVFALSALYMAQGIPFGFATEYLPVVLREQRYGYTAIAALSWLQLPWQLKVLWAKAADHPRLRRRTRGFILLMQLALTVTVASFAIAPLAHAPRMWFTLTALAAALAATQDVFVDAFAVRALRESERGYGNTAQVAGYRIGMLVGGAALLLFVERLGERATLLACAAVVALASVGAFLSTGEAPTRAAEEAPHAPTRVGALLRHMTGAGAWPVIVVALSFKLGLHTASALLKPMAVDYGWTKAQIGGAMVTVGSVGAIVGSVAGGTLHRLTSERRSLVLAALVQASVCFPLVLVERMHAPIGITTVAIALEHFGSGLGTTVLFAALMTATRPADAGLHYTVLTSANALAIGIGGFLGGVLADTLGKLAAFAIAAVLCLCPLLVLRRWPAAARASAGLHSGKQDHA